MKVINLIGGANTGKTTAAFGLMYAMKKMGLRVQYAGEYAAEMVSEHRSNILDDQLYILAKQNRRLDRLRDQVDYVITDTSLLLGCVYAKSGEPSALADIIWAKFLGYDNQVFYIPRNYDFLFDKESRVQASHAEASAFDKVILTLLSNVPNTHYLSTKTDYVEQILNILNLRGSLEAAA